MKTVNVAVIGCGFAGNFHSNAWRKVKNVNVVLKAAVDNDKKRAIDLAEKWDYEKAVFDFEEVLKDDSIDVVDIALPPVLHLPFAYKAMEAGKHVICDKPLTGYFGKEEDQEPIGKTVPKSKMYEYILKELKEAKAKIGSSDKLFMYAENYLYAPSILKAAELLKEKKSRIVYMQAECSIHGSTSVLSGDWKSVGGGTLMRLGTHSIAGVLYLKRVEAMANGIEVHPVSVVADTGQIVTNFTDEERKYLPCDPHDVEDFLNLTITFSDGTKAIVVSNDNVMGGIKNYINLYLNDGVLECKMTSCDDMKSFYVDDSKLENVYISEKLNCKTGWNNVFISEEVMRGYVGEFQNFAECIANNQKPDSDLDLAIETTKIMYAAYVSAEEGRRVSL